LHAINTDSTLSVEEKERRKEELTKEYAEKSDRVHSISQLLRAYSLFERDVEYVVSDGKVLIVDEFTGRLMPGRRYSDGLHQALEAKEGVRVEGETQTLATITLQNYFRMYHKLAGMTGTAETEAAEFWDIYKLDVVVIPTHDRVRRVDHEDQIYRTRREKYNAVIDEIADMHSRKRPVLVGTISVEVSETLSRMLKRKGIPHSVLNAKYHQQEAEIVSRAGQPGAVTIATNMAGRGTDIKLGPGVSEAGGLHVLGTERHEARRVDRQLEGRAGRQGDPGSAQFYLSLEDELLEGLGPEKQQELQEIGQQGGAVDWQSYDRVFLKAQRRLEKRHYRQRVDLMVYEKNRREVLKDLGADPYVD
jgi:preprotein translocase subunit SecA